MAHLEFNECWLEHDGKRVQIDGRAHTLRVRTWRAVYPYEHTAISVFAEPANRRAVEYLKTKRELGDDWDTDVLESSIELQVELLEQLQQQPS